MVGQLVFWALVGAFIGALWDWCRFYFGIKRFHWMFRWPEKSEGGKQNDTGDTGQGHSDR